MKKHLPMFSSAVVLLSLLFGLVQAQGYEVLGKFKTVSGNVYCLATLDRITREAGLTCDMVSVTSTKPAKPKPKDCTLDWGQSFFLGERGKPDLVCSGDTIIDNSYKVLPYNQKWQIGGFICDATTARLRCVNRDKNGFELSKAVQKLF
jgi:hypothetical protein